MRAYVMLTGTLFALLALTHVARMIDEWPRVIEDPSFIALMAVTTLGPAALSVWAWRLVRGDRRP